MTLSKSIKIRDFPGLEGAEQGAGVSQVPSWCHPEGIMTLRG